MCALLSGLYIGSDHEGRGGGGGGGGGLAKEGKKCVFKHFACWVKISADNILK